MASRRLQYIVLSELNKAARKLKLKLLHFRVGVGFLKSELMDLFCLLLSLYLLRTQAGGVQNKKIPKPGAMGELMSHSIKKLDLLT